MNLLAMDTTSAPLSLALKTNKKTFVLHREFFLPHDETLLPQVRRLLNKAGLKWEDLDAMVVASGPGRFTGIRIGMSFAAVMAGRLRIPALAVSRLEALAARTPGNLVCAVLPGYRDEIFYRLYRRGVSGHSSPVEAPAWAVPKEWLRARRKIADRGAVFAEGEVRAADLLDCAERLLKRRRRPKFEPLYLKPASYETSRPGA